MPRRKRIDPDDAPIDGDYRKDQVLNKDPGKAYALVAADDMPIMNGRGYVRTQRAEGGAKPAWDIGGDGDLTVAGQLVLMETSKENAEKIQKRGEKQWADRYKGLDRSIKDYVKANPGSEYKRAVG